MIKEIERIMESRNEIEGGLFKGLLIFNCILGIINVILFVMYL